MVPVKLTKMLFFQDVDFSIQHFFNIQYKMLKNQCCFNFEYSTSKDVSQLQGNDPITKMCTFWKLLVFKKKMHKIIISAIDRIGILC